MANLHPRRNRSEADSQPSSLQFEALEPRVLFSATAVEPLAAGASSHHDLPQVQMESIIETGAVSGGETATHEAEDQIIGGLNYRAADLDSAKSTELVFLTSGLFDDDYLAQHLDPAYEVYLIEPGSDAIGQIAAVLEGRSGVDAIHLIGHGEDGRLFLGETVLDADSMKGHHALLLGQIGSSLSEQADLLIYGCDFTSGDEGVEAASLLASITGADVAASNDKTGHAGLGGDWELETATGEIEATSIAMSSWRGVLAATDIAAQPASLQIYDAGNNPVTVGNTVGTGGRAVWVGAGTVGGQTIDLIANVISVGAGDSVEFQNPLSGTDDPSFVLNSGGTNESGQAVIEWSIVLTGTAIPAVGDITFTIADIDGIGGNPNTRETVIPSLNGLTAYGANDPTNIEFSVSGGSVIASGTENQNTGGGQADPEAAALFTWRNVSSWQITYQLAANNVTGQARFAHDGDGDFVFTNLETVQLLGVDLDGNDSTETGSDYLTRFTEGGGPVTISDSDTTITQNIALGTDLTSATVTLTNAQTGDELLVNGLPALTGSISGVNYTITTGGGEIEIEFTGTASVTTYESILESITFRNSQTGISAVDRVIEVTVFNSFFGTTSNTAISRIEINRPPVANPATTNTGFQTAVTVNLLGNDTDADGDTITIVGTPTVANPAHGTLALVGGNWVFTPAGTFSGTAVINYTIQDVHGATSSSTHSVVVENSPPVLTDPTPGPGTPYVNPLNPTNLIVPAVDNVFVSVDLDDYFTDANGHSLTFTPNLAGVPAWLTYNAGNRTFSGTPPVDNVGPVTIPVLVSDGNGGILNASVTIDPVNPGPTANPATTNTGFQTPVTVNLLGNDTDPDGDPLSVVGTPTLVNPAHGSLALVGGNWVFTPASTFSGTAVINYTIQDQDGSTSSSTHSVVVENAPPVLVDNNLTPGTPYINPLAPTNLIVPATDNVPVSIDLDDYFADGNLDTLNFAPNLASLPAWLSYNPTTHVLSGTPPIDNAGPVTIPITVTDGNGGTFNGSITVSPVNPGPVANFQSVSTSFQTPVVLNLLGNDSDPDGDPFSVRGVPTVANPAHGTVSFSGGNWVFTPASTFSGTAVINYTIIDDDGATASSTHEVVVENAPPVLTDPTPGPGTPYVNPLDPTNLIVPAVDNVFVSVDLDDYFVDGNLDTLTFTPNLAGVPAWLTYNAGNRTFSGTPPVDNVGSVTIPVLVSDGNGGNLNASVTISPVNPGPTANPATTNTGFQTPVTVNLLGNDTDPDGDPLSIVGTPTLVNPAHGSLALVGGNWVFTPAGTFSGTAVINYTIQDQDGATSSSTHSVVVENAPPVLTDPTPGPGTPYVNPLDPNNLIVPATDNVPVSIDLDDYFADGNLDTLTITPNLVGLPGWLSYNPTTRVLSGTPPVDNAGVPVVIPITVTDGNGGTFNGSILIDPVNPGPTANPATTNTGFQTPVTVNLLGNDTDPDGDPLSVVGTPTLVNPAHGSLALVGGNWVFTPAGTFSGTAVINYTIQDQDGATSSSTHSVVVENAPPVLVDNDLTPGTPYINPLAPTNLIVPAMDSVPVSIDLDTYITDANGDTLNFTPNLASLPAWLSYNPTTNVLSGTPPIDNAGPVTIPITVTDGNGGTFNGSITVSPVNPGPVANFQSVSTNFQTPVVLNLLGNDSDPDGDPFWVRGTPTVANPAHGTVSFSDGNWVFTPAGTFSGTAVINYTIIDDDGATASSTHEVVVANAVPELCDHDLTPGTPYANPLDPNNLIVPAVDNVFFTVDLDEFFVDGNNDPLTFTPNLAGVPAWLTYNAGNRTFSGTPPVDNVGSVTIPVLVSDGNGGNLNASVTIDPVNPGPTANPATTNTGFQTPVTVNLLGNDTDPDGDPLSIVGTPTLVNPAHGSLALVGGNWVFTPASTFSGTAVINYTIQDQDGATSSSTHSVVVENAPPVLVDNNLTPGTPYINPLDPTNLIVPATDNVLVSIDLDDYFADGNLDALTITPNLVGLPAWLSYNPTTRILSGTPPVDNVGVPVVIPVAVTDGNGGTFNGSILISPVNPGPTANPATTNTGFQTPVTVNLLGNDTDPDGDPLSIVGTPTLVNPAHGSLALVGGNWVFTPATTFSGSAVINYTIQDQDGATSSSTHEIVVANALPELVDNNLAPGTPYIDPLDPENLIVPAVDNVPVSIDLDDYFEDGNLDTLTITPNLAGLPGWVTYNPATKQLSGTPPIDNDGPVVVPVTVTDGNGGVFTGTITIDPVNPGPDADDDDYDVLNTTPVVVVGNALANDSDPDGDPLTAVVATDVPGSDGGLFTIDADGEVTFDPDGAFDDLLGGETRTTSFTYTLVDADGETSTATVTVTVTGVNSPPVPNSGAITVNVGSQGGGLGLTAPTDPDGDSLTITVKKLPRVGVLRLANGTPVKVGQVLTSKQLENLVFDAPASYKGKKPVKFIYTVSDGQYVTTAKVDISIVQGVACYPSMPASMKGGMKKARD